LQIASQVLLLGAFGALLADFWPEPYELPASRAHLVESY
jgi:hypothetical protein